MPVAVKFEFGIEEIVEVYVKYLIIPQAFVDFHQKIPDCQQLFLHRSSGDGSPPRGHIGNDLFVGQLQFPAKCFLL